MVFCGDPGVSDPDFLVDVAGPEPLVVLATDSSLSADLPDTPIAVDFVAVGIPGRDGESSADIEAVSAAVLPAGLPVAIDRASGRFVAADAAWKPHAFVAGLLRDAAAEGFVAAAATAQLTLADWSAVTGSASLSPGVLYFLAVGGGLTVTAPASGACLTLVGKALNASTLVIDPLPPIEL
jgi:hypothetical protein